MKVWSEGGLIDEADALIEAFSPAAMYGQGLFERIRIYRGWPFRLADHLSRLEQSAVALGLSLPNSFELLADGISSLIEGNGVEEGVVFILLLAAVGGSRLFVRTEPLPEELEALSRDGVRAMTAVGPLPLARHQSCLRWVRRLHLGKAYSSGLNEVVILSPDGIVLEAVESAIGFAKKETLYLPPEDLPLLPRTSMHTFAAAAKRIGLEAKRMRFYPIDLLEADEVFLVNSICEVLSLLELDGKPIGGGGKGQLYQGLSMAYRDLVFEELKPRL